MAENVTLEFLGRQFERLFTELAEMRSEQVSVREDMRILTAIVLRHDTTLNGILDQLHAMTAQLNRLGMPLRWLEEQRAPT